MQNETPTQKPVVSKRKPLKILMGIAVAAIGLAALYLHLMDPPRPWIVRWQTQRYLKKQTGNSNFKVDFPFPSKAEMAKRSPKPEKTLTKGPKTGKDFDTLKNEYIKLKSSIFTSENNLAEHQKEVVDRKVLVESLTKQLAEAQAANGTNISRLQENLTNQVQRIARVVETEIPALQDEVKNIPAKEEQLVPIVSDLWEFQRLWAAEQAVLDAQPENVLAKARTQMNVEMRKKLDDAKSYAAIYRVIGEALFVGGRLLDSANDAHRQNGMGLVLQAMQYSRDDAQNFWLAARIAEGYIWPNLDVGQDNRRSQMNAEGLLNTAANAFRENAEYENVVRNYEIMLSRATTPQRQDWARSQIAFAHEQAGDYKLAIENLRAIKATNDFRWQIRNIPRLEDRLKYSRNK
jgi:gas vesicle protein